MESAWLILLLIVFVCIVVLTYTRKQATEGFAEFADASTRFGNAQDTYFHDEAGKAIFTNPGLALGDLNTALRQPDVYLPTSPDRDYLSYFAEDPENAFSKNDMEFCRKAKHPKDLPERTPGSRIGCGWYYALDASTPSVGALGSREGPLFRTGLPANGTWIWDRPTAIMKEDIKMCKRIKSCDLMNTPGIAGECGFCERLGYAVPIQSDGTEKYPDSEEGSCGEATKNTVGDCYRPAANEITTPEGVSCGSLGKPSADNSLRIYTKEECDKLGGIIQAGGECKRQDGGSFSWDCRLLNAPPGILTDMPALDENGNPIPGATPRRKCDPANGRLTRECLISLAEGLGYSKSGAILSMLYSTNAPTEVDRLAIAQVRNAGVIVPEAVLGNGEIDAQSAGTIYKRIFDVMSTGSTNLIRESAKHLVTGTKEFDICDIDGKTRGPFQLYCLQRKFRETGCQPAGSKFPTKITATEYANMTWDEVGGVFRTLKDAMNSSNAKDQDKATKECLGVTFYRKPPVPCTDPGMEYLYYSYSTGDRLAYLIGTIPAIRVGTWVIRPEQPIYESYAAFMGSTRNEVGFQQFSDNMNSMNIGPSQRRDMLMVKMRGMINPPKAIQGNIDLWTDDGVKVIVNDSVVLDRWFDQATTYYAAPVNVPAGRLTKFEMQWYDIGGAGGLDARGAITTINNAVFLPFPKDGPTIAFDFFRGSLGDTRGVMKSRPTNMNIVTKGGKQCAQFKFGSFIQILTPYRFKAIRTMTYMIYYDNFNSTRPVYIFNAMRNANGQDSTHIMMRDNANFVYFAKFPDGYAAGFPPIATGRWVHMALVYTNDFKGITIYRNGEVVGTEYSGRLYDGGPAPDEILRYVYLGRHGYDYSQQTCPNAGLGWFHMYERALSISEIKAEMNYWNNPVYANTPLLTFAEAKSRDGPVA